MLHKKPQFPKIEQTLENKYDMIYDTDYGMD